jgi:hypothetical protein
MIRVRSSLCLLTLVGGSFLAGCMRFSPEYPEPPPAPFDGSVDGDAAGDAESGDVADGGAVDGSADAADAETDPG